ncbi:MAG: hypothetical protein ACYDAC_00740 [Candidatus Dormibacteria bacterium]
MRTHGFVELVEERARTGVHLMAIGVGAMTSAHPQQAGVARLALDHYLSVRQWTADCRRSFGIEELDMPPVDPHARGRLVDEPKQELALTGTIEPKTPSPPRACAAEGPLSTEECHHL